MRIRRRRILFEPICCQRSIWCLRCDGIINAQGGPIPSADVLQAMLQVAHLRHLPFRADLDAEAARQRLTQHDTRIRIFQLAAPIPNAVFITIGD